MTLGRRGRIGHDVTATRRAPSRRALVLVWVGAVGVLVALVAVSRVTQSGGDDPDPARQRPGILDLGELPVPAPRLAPGVPAAGQVTVVFFAGGDAARLCARVADPPPQLARSQLVVVAHDAAGCPPAVTVLEMAVGEAARRYGLATPRDGGVPSGYALVDRGGRIRYRTLDPVAPALLDEVATMVRAL